MEFWVTLIVSLILSALIGVWIGNLRGRSGDGALYSLILGPIGWLIILIGPDYRPKCPECLGVIEEGARRCKNCGVDMTRQSRDSGEVRMQPRVLHPVVKSHIPAPKIRHPHPVIRPR